MPYVDNVFASHRGYHGDDCTRSFHRDLFFFERMVRLMPISCVCLVGDNFNVNPSKLQILVPAPVGGAGAYEFNLASKTIQNYNIPLSEVQVS